LTGRLVPRLAPAEVIALPPCDGSPDDLPAQLRLLADRLDAGCHGDVVGIAVVLERNYAQVPLIGGFGAAEEATRAYALLHLGAQRLGAALLAGTVRSEV
jgi:hypothetical protein